MIFSARSRRKNPASIKPPTISPTRPPPTEMSKAPKAPKPRKTLALRSDARPAVRNGSVAGVERRPQLVFGDLWPYEPAPESAEAGIKGRYDLFIGGKFVAAKSGRYFDSINPANERKLSEIALAGAADVDAAYAAARGAFDGAWG